MSEAAWSFQHTVEFDAPCDFAWKYWGNLANWDDPPAKFELDGPFEAGSTLTTILPGQRLQSLLREVDPGRGATIEMELPGAILYFVWIFEEASARRTRITQRLALSGEAAGSLVGQARVMEQSVPDGMKRISAAIERAWRADN
jgi:hypothetical protein